MPACGVLSLVIDLLPAATCMCVCVCGMLSLPLSVLPKWSTQYLRAVLD